MDELINVYDNMIFADDCKCEYSLTELIEVDIHDEWFIEWCKYAKVGDFCGYNGLIIARIK